MVEEAPGQNIKETAEEGRFRTVDRALMAYTLGMPEEAAEFIGLEGDAMIRKRRELYDEFLRLEAQVPPAKRYEVQGEIRDELVGKLIAKKRPDLAKSWAKETFPEGAEEGGGGG